MKFYKDKSILEIIINKFKHLPYPIIVTTTPYSIQTISQSQRAGVPVMVGGVGDILSRFCEVADKFDLDGVFRVCADNPFIQLPLMFPVEAWSTNYDYVAFDHCMQRHEGFWLEYVKADALYVANNRLVLDSKRREHVTSFIYGNPGMYNIKWLPIPPELNERQIHLTVDTKDDFECAQAVYKDVGEKHWHYIIDYFYGVKHG